MLSPLEAFKYGFLSRCVEDGCTSEQTLARVKVAEDLLEKRGFVGGILGSAFDKALDVGKGVGHAALHIGLPLAVAAPPILGGVAGYGLAKATDIDDTDVQAIKDQEVLDELHRQTAKLKRQQTVRGLKQTTERAPRPLL